VAQRLSLYRSQEGPLHWLNPLTKLTLTFCIVLVDFLGPGYWLPTLLFVGVLVPLSLWGRVAGAFGRTMAGLLLPVAGFLFVMQSLFYPGGRTVIFSFWVFDVTAEGVRFGYLIASRILTMVGAFLLLLFTTHPGTLMADLNRRGVSPSLTYIIVSTLQIVPEMRAKANTIIDAQRARGLETGGNPLQRVRALVPLVGPLVFGSLVDVEERAIALEARAFKAKRVKTSLLEIPDSSGQRWARYVLLGLTVIGIGLHLWL
jgi:energy-coupling factor transport system permease protein